MDAETLLAEITQKPKAWVVAHPEARLDTEQQLSLQSAVSQLEHGLPLPYVLGHWDFYGLEFIINPHVLIPRPETELLVEEVLNYLSSRVAPPDLQRKPNPHLWAAADVGTGSGIIAVCLAKANPGLSILAVDRSKAALSVARQNAEKHGVANQVAFLQCDILAAVEHKFDLIAANLPYIPSSTLFNLPVAKHEPCLALDGGPDGLDLYRRLLSDASRVMVPGGRIFLEIEANRGGDIAELAKAALPRASCAIKKDLQGHERLAILSV